MNGLQDVITVFSPAKVNLHLTVFDKRADGFHNLESVFLAVNFGDTLHFQTVNPENSIEITMKGMDSVIPAEKNIIFKAISLFRQKTGFSKGLNITVEKRIPQGGGLGGGSSNAASTLLTLNRLAGLPCGKDALLDMAASLGSDVPFFVSETPAALVTGRGEQIQPIEAPSLYFTLVNPGFSSDTAAAFRLLDECREKETSHGGTKAQSCRSLSVPNSQEISVNYPKYLRNMFNISDNNFVPLCLCEINFSNDFLSIFPEKEKSVYNAIISRLRELGAQFSGVSGTGSTCFGVFEDEQKAQKAAEIMRESWDFSVFCGIKQ